jgi:hypothetical protein
MSNKNTLTGLVIGIMTALLLGALALPVVSRATGSWPDGSTTDAGAIPKNLINSPVISTGSTPHVIPAAAFRDDGISDYFFSFGNGYIRSTGSASACLMAPVYLPDGILMDYLRIYAYDNHAANFTMELRRKENSSTSSSQVLASVTTSGSSSAVQKVTDTTIGSPVVDNRNYSYFLSTCLNSTTTSHRFYAAELGFRFFTYLPAVLKDFCGGFPGPAESEPNDSTALANGSLCSGRAYTGSPDDASPLLESDYFYIDTSTSGAINVSVTNFLPVGQVQLYYQSTANLIANVPDQGSGNYIINHNGPAGRYFIRVVAPAAHPTGNGDYNLTVTFP